VGPAAIMLLYTAGVTAKRAHSSLKVHSHAVCHNPDNSSGIILTWPAVNSMIEFEASQWKHAYWTNT